ncbi:conserved hypothetical protein [Ricinus communis]|uniref:Uncharacterized protein n=1 Tax=Ricinus communis TaxID=3988 RepID=B9T7K4_RICCO|nr:conserved hypothetical protein [Ricinus communis]
MEQMVQMFLCQLHIMPLPGLTGPVSLPAGSSGAAATRCEDDGAFMTKEDY